MPNLPTIELVQQLLKLIADDPNLIQTPVEVQSRDGGMHYKTATRVHVYRGRVRIKFE